MTFFGAFLLFVSIWSFGKSTEIRGPPLAEQSVLQLIESVGKTIRIQCPISGYPEPMIEWSRDGDIINDYSWERYRIVKNDILKIRRANVKEDTGVFKCKGINGFGSESVRIEVIVIDPLQFPSLSVSSSQTSLDASPPIFIDSSSFEWNSEYRISLNEKFYANCEALGSPVPSLYWTKDNLPLSSKRFNVLSSRSSLSLSFSVTSSDEGVYRCRASNDYGDVERVFSLSVQEPSLSILSLLLNGSSDSSSVSEGESAILSCRVKSSNLTPSFKWLKKLEGIEKVTSEDVIILVGTERYKVLQTESKSRRDESLDTFTHEYTIPNGLSSDSGTYICFVSSLENGKHSYKSKILKVIPVWHSSSSPYPSTSDPILISIIFLSLFCLLGTLLVFTFHFVKRSREKKKRENQKSSEEEPESVLESSKPFMSIPHHYHHHHKIGSSFKETPFHLSSKSLAAWSVNSLSTHYETPNSKLLLDSSGSGNMYEVPFSHIMIPESPLPPPLPPFNDRHFSSYHHHSRYHSRYPRHPYPRR